MLFGMLLYQRMMCGIFGHFSRHDGCLPDGTWRRFSISGPKVGGAGSPGMQQACIEVANADRSSDRDPPTQRGEVDEKDDRPRMAGGDEA